MSLNAGTVVAVGRLDHTQFTRGMSQMRQQGLQGTAQIDKGFQGIGNTIMNLRNLMVVGLGVAITRAAKKAVDDFAEFESSLTKITTLVGVSTKEVAKFEKGIMKLATATGRAPRELADAMFFITSAGLRGAEAMRVLEMSAKGSAVGLGETKTIADLVTSAMNAYGVETLSASKATNILVASVREGKAEASELAQSMGMVLPVASEMGVSFDQVGAAIAAMTRTGTNAATASTQLRQILVSILNPAEGARDALAEMGTSAEGLRRQLREEGLISVLGFLRDQMENNEEAMSNVFGNVRALMGALDIMGANAEDNVKIFGALAKTTNELEDAFSGTADTVKFKQNQLNSEFQKTNTIIGEQLAPSFIRLNETLIDTLKIFQDLAEPIGKVADQFGRFDFVSKFVRDMANSRRALREMREEVDRILESDFSGMTNIEMSQALVHIGDRMREIGDLATSLGVDPKTLSSYQQMEGVVDRIFSLMGKTTESQDEVAGGAGGVNTKTEETIKTVGQLDEEIRKLQDSIKNSFDRAAIIGFEDQIHILENSIRSLMGTLKPDTPIAEPFHDLEQALLDVDEAMKSNLLFGGGADGMIIPEGSLMDLRQQVRALNEELEVTTDPERQEFLRQQIEGLNTAIGQVTNGLIESGGASLFFTRSLADGLDQVLFRARSVEDAIKGIIRQLASRAFLVGIGALLTSGASLEGTTFLKAMFGGGRHTGGVVPGVGDRQMTLKGGESVLTAGQMKALGGMVNRPSGMSPVAMEKAFDRALSKHLSTLRPNEFAVLTAEGNRFEDRLR